MHRILVWAGLVVVFLIVAVFAASALVPARSLDAAAFRGLWAESARNSADAWWLVKVEPDGYLLLHLRGMKMERIEVRKADVEIHPSKPCSGDAGLCWRNLKFPDVRVKTDEHVGSER